MLDVLKNLKCLGGKEGLLFFLCDVIGDRQVSLSDAEILCSHFSGTHVLSGKELACYCEAWGWIQVTKESMTLSPSIVLLINNQDDLNETLVLSTVKQLFDKNILTANMFFYDSVRHKYGFKNELFPLSLSGVRNMLISQGLLSTQRDLWGTHFYLNIKYDSFIAKYCKEKRRQISLEELKKKLDKNEIAGEKAEIYVLEFEKNRLGLPLSKKVKRISEIDVAAGYDIISYNSLCSKEPDRFIEVKAVGENGFYWSKNEYDIAKLKGEFYYLYLVDLQKINRLDYEPKIIQNPAVAIMTSESWLIEAQSFYIRHI